MIVRARIKPIFEGSMFEPFQPFQSFNLLRHRVAKKSKTYKFEACKKPSNALIDIFSLIKMSAIIANMKYMR